MSLYLFIFSRKNTKEPDDTKSYGIHGIMETLANFLSFSSLSSSHQESSWHEKSDRDEKNVTRLISRVWFFFVFFLSCISLTEHTWCLMLCFCNIDDKIRRRRKGRMSKINNRKVNRRIVTCHQNIFICFYSKWALTGNQFGSVYHLMDIILSLWLCWIEHEEISSHCLWGDCSWNFSILPELVIVV